MRLVSLSTLLSWSPSIADDASAATGNTYGNDDHIAWEGEDNIARAERSLQVAEAFLERCAVAEATAENSAKETKRLYDEAVELYPLEGGSYLWRKRSADEIEARQRLNLLSKQSKRADNDLRRATMRFLQAQEQERKARDALTNTRFSLMKASKTRTGDERSCSSHEKIGPRFVVMTAELNIT